ncbi:chordopoxvirus fusion protein [Thermosulfurimonas marina]|uniref:Chordopoxvirus fusion protein n=1 Tax=Thermosulfurimonas marina TaxID=2047767 RepID=A0A6H1WSF3_9BACT|nr:chordopoxvirus fusion protein [Thermosulfurimonas marina]QJA06084.1 chordopoxvirus fusion protein [Thermosulfurimonas marina]
MFNPLRYLEDFRESFGEEAALKLLRALGEIYENLAQTVTREEFNELKEIVRQQGENLKVLTQRMDQLTQRVDQLTERMDQLTQRVDQLTEDVRQLTLRVDQLTEDVRRLTGEMGKMKGDLRDLRQQVGGLSITVGYTLENQAYRALPRLLARDYGLRVKGRLLRTFVEDDKGRPLEVNIFGRAQRDGQEVVILGEAKAQLSKRDVDRFLRKKVRPLEKVFPERFLVLVTHMISEPSVEAYARDRGVVLYYSYDFEGPEEAPF